MFYFLLHFSLVFFYYSLFATPISALFVLLFQKHALTLPSLSFSAVYFIIHVGEIRALYYVAVSESGVAMVLFFWFSWNLQNEPIHFKSINLVLSVWYDVCEYMHAWLFRVFHPTYCRACCRQIFILTVRVLAVLTSCPTVMTCRPVFAMHRRHAILQPHGWLKKQQHCFCKYFFLIPILCSLHIFCFPPKPLTLQQR